MKKLIYKFKIIILLTFLNSTVLAFPKSPYKDHIKPSFSDGFDKVGLWVLLVGGAAAAIVKPQDEVNNQWVKDNVEIGESVLKFGDFFGSGIPGLAMAATQYKHSPPHGRAHFEAIIYNGISVAALKGAFERERPNGGNHSMPSGHVSTAFASATSLSYSYGTTWAIPAYSVATLVALQRIIHDAHWVSDTIAGAAIGFFWGRATYKHELNILPVIDTKKVGFIWKKNF